MLLLQWVKGRLIDPPWVTVLMRPLLTRNSALRGLSGRMSTVTHGESLTGS